MVPKSNAFIHTLSASTVVMKRSARIGNNLDDILAKRPLDFE